MLLGECNSGKTWPWGELIPVGLMVHIECSVVKAEDKVARVEVETLSPLEYTGQVMC